MKQLIIFAAGLAVGAGVGWYFTKGKYEAKADEEIADVVNRFSGNAEEPVDKVVDPIKEDYINPKDLSDANLNKPAILDYAEVLQKENYVDYSNSGREESKKKAKKKGPVSIHPTELGEEEDYDIITLRYFDDGVLAYDETLQEVEDVKGSVGANFASHFGEYEEDAVYIKNEKKGLYYEILRDERLYTDAVAELPREVEIEYGPEE